VLLHPVGRDADVLEAPLRLPLGQQRQQGLGAAQVVHLHQLDRTAQPLERRLQARLARRAVLAVDLGGHEHVFANTQVRQQLAQHILGDAVIGRGIEQASAEPMEGL
jgi:hypothetical protein